MSKQDIIQYVVIGLLTGMFWFQRGGKDTLAATQDTLGARFAACLGSLSSSPASSPSLSCRPWPVALSAVLGVKST